MLDGIEALVALEQTGSISKAAVKLRLTQSAVSKRLQALERTFKGKIIERDGRNVRITESGHAFLAKAKPLLLELRSLNDDRVTQRRRFALGISDSIASTWGPRVIRKCLISIPNLELDLHVHRSTLVVEQIRSGRYDLGLVAGLPVGKDLSWEVLAQEPMVLVSHRDTEKKILTIEPSSATWREVGKKVLAHTLFNGREFVFLESFAAAGQMSSEGFGSALLPQGVAQLLTPSSNIKLLSPKISRQIHLVARKSVVNLESVQRLYSALRLETARVIKLRS